MAIDRVDLERPPPRWPNASGHPADRRRDPAPEHRARRLGLAGGTVVHGNSWADDILAGAASIDARPTPRPTGSPASCAPTRPRRSAWLGFLDAAELGGCLALDMGLGKTPTVLAHLARTAGDGPALVVAPAAVVGNWAAEAARFAPGLRVRGAPRRRRAPATDELEREVAAPTWSSPPTPRPCATWTRWPHQLGDDGARRGAGDQEPGQRHGPAAAPDPGPHAARAHRHADRERPRRPVGDPRLHQPRSGRAAAAVRRPDVGRRRGGAAGAERHPAVPPHQEPSPRSPPSCPTRSTSSTTAP